MKLVQGAAWVVELDQGQGVHENVDISDPFPISPLLSPMGSFSEASFAYTPAGKPPRTTPRGSDPSTGSSLTQSPLILPSVLPTLRGPLGSQFQVILSTHLPSIVPSTLLSRPHCPVCPRLQHYRGPTSPVRPAPPYFPWPPRLSAPTFTCSPSGHRWALALLPTLGWRTPGPTHLKAPQPRNPGEAAAPAIPTQMTDITMVRSSDSLKGPLAPAPISPLSLLGHTAGS